MLVEAEVLLEDVLWNMFLASLSLADTLSLFFVSQPPGMQQLCPATLFCPHEPASQLRDHGWKPRKLCAKINLHLVVGFIYFVLETGNMSTTNTVLLTVIAFCNTRSLEHSNIALQEIYLLFLCYYIIGKRDFFLFFLHF